MVLSETQIRILDISEESTLKTNISTIFNRYILDSKKLDNGEEIIHFGDTQKNYIKTDDVRGWTDVQFIKKIPIENLVDQSIYQIIINIKNGERLDTRELFLTPESLVPLFTKNSFSSGFHGEIKYEYVLHSMEYIHHGGISLEHDRFNELRIEGMFLDQFVSGNSIIVNKCIENKERYVYEIKTCSGWFIGNDILLFNGENNKNGRLYK